MPKQFNAEAFKTVLGSNLSHFMTKFGAEVSEIKLHENTVFVLFRKNDLEIDIYARHWPPEGTEKPNYSIDPSRWSPTIMTMFERSFIKALKIAYQKPAITH